MGVSEPHMRHNFKSDKGLILALKAGDVAAYEALFVRYHAILRRFIVSVIKDETAADDLTQDSFMALWSARESLEPDRPIQGWLYVTARNKAVNWLKSKVRQKGDIVEEPADEAPAQDYLLDMKAALSRVEEEMKSLPPRSREVFRMSRFDGKTREEIARELGIALRTVDKHLEVANRILRKNAN